MIDPLLHSPAFSRSPLPGAGVLAEEHVGLELAMIAARPGMLAQLATCVRERHDLELPMGRQRVSSGSFSFAGIAPDTWLVAAEPGSGPSLTASLEETLGDLAAVFEQTHGTAVLRLSGPHVRITLARLLPLDLHERAFRVGEVASTLAGHIGVTLWRLEDRAPGIGVFEVAVARSFSQSFWESLVDCTASL